MNHSSSPLFPSVAERQIRQVQAVRRARASYFKPDLFADPAWDILLELYAGELAQRRVSVSKASIAAGVPATTALRWIHKLEQDNLIDRELDTVDARRVWLALTAPSAIAMRSYFEAVSTTSLPLC